jgi:hypothetical protein
LAGAGFLAGVVAGPDAPLSAGRKITRIFLSWIELFGADSHYNRSQYNSKKGPPPSTRGLGVRELRPRTISETLVNSLSASMGIAWTRNLSRHLASAGGSAFIAWRSTVAGQVRS